MAWHHVEDSAPVVGAAPFTGTRRVPSWGFYGARHEPAISTALVGHTTWRCGSCRALAVTPYREQPKQPKTDCGKCGSK